MAFGWMKQRSLNPLLPINPPKWKLSLHFFSLSVRTVWGESLVVLLPVCSLTFRTHDRKLWQLPEATEGDTAHWVSRQEFLPTISQEGYILANAKIV